MDRIYRDEFKDQEQMDRIYMINKIKTKTILD